jgi:ribosomal protein S18 acetylase RimI-like enzyme
MSTSHIDLKPGSDLPFDQLLDLYNSVGWRNYTSEEQRDLLPRALHNSTYVISAWDQDRLVGLARGLSDDVSIFYLQDILIHPEYQRKGVGRQLLTNCLERFRHVRQKVLLTDDEEKQLLFYESLGYHNTRKIQSMQLNTFIIIEGLKLE